MGRKTERDERFGRRYLLRNLLKMIPTLIGFYFLWRSASSGIMQGFDFWFGVVSFVLGIGMWAWSDRLLFKSYHCPRCGEHLPEPKIKYPEESDPIIYVCETCDIEWDTTLRT